MSEEAKRITARAEELIGPVDDQSKSDKWETMVMEHAEYKSAVASGEREADPFMDHLSEAIGHLEILRADRMEHEAPETP